MKSINLAPVAFAALLFGCAIANAQTSPATSSESSNTASASSAADTTKGNDLTGTTPADQVSVPPTAGQDKSSGNDLVSPKGDTTKSSMKHASKARPDFSTLDTKHTGALTADDVKDHKWLRKNFARCDSNHDGKLSSEEYAACK
jgi:hypothetical protein